MADLYRSALRRSMQQVRLCLSAHYQKITSAKVCQHIFSLEHYKKAQHIALYSAFKGEIDLTSLWEGACSQGKQCYFPRLNQEDSLSFFAAEPQDAFKKNRYGILEPDSKEPAIALIDLDLIIMPIVAFDPYGTRLGMGAGFYDRTLKEATAATLMGVAYPFQKINFIEPRAWDVPLDAIITATDIYTQDTSKRDFYADAFSDQKATKNSQ